MRDASDVDSSVTAVREVLLTSTARELNRAEESVYGLWCILQYIYIYEQGPPHPPSPPARWFPPPPCGRGGGFSQQPAKPYVSIIRMDMLYVK